MPNYYVPDSLKNGNGGSGGGSSYNDSDIRNKIRVVENRVTTLESDKKASLNINSLSNSGGTEIQSNISQEANFIQFNYQKNTNNELPNYLNTQINGDNFSLATTAYVDNAVSNIQGGTGGAIVANRKQGDIVISDILEIKDKEIDPTGVTFNLDKFNTTGIVNAFFKSQGQNIASVDLVDKNTNALVYYYDKIYIDNNTIRALFDQEYQYLRIFDKNENIDLGFSKESDDTLRIQEYAKDDRGQTQNIFDMVLPNKEYVDSAVNGAKLRRTVVGEERLIGEFIWDGVTYDHYEKIIDFGALPNSTQKTAAHGIPNPKTIIKIYGEARNSSNNLAIPFVSANGSLFTYLGVGANNITIGTNSDRSSYSALIYIEFLRARA